MEECMDKIEDEIIITESDAVHPVLLIPKKCTMLETRCEATDNVLIYLNITSYDTEGNDTSIYSGFCNVKVVDSYDLKMLDVDQNNQLSDFNDNHVPIVVPDPGIQGLNTSDPQSQVWIDPARSPYVHNSYGAMEAEKRYSIYHHNTHSGHITVEQHNTYITQNVYNYNEAIQYSPVEELERNKLKKNLFNDANQQFTADIDLDEEFECGVFLSQLPEEIMNENENRVREELKFIGLQSGNDALKQLMSSDIQSFSKQQKTILYLGHDSQYGQTIQNIAVNDPTITCVDNGIDNENVIGSNEPNTKRYQCDKCKKIFVQITAFKKHIQGSHTNTRTPRFKHKSSYINFSCRKCGKVLKNQKKFELHCLGHGDPNVECIKCNKVFASKFSLRNHLKIHQRKHKCMYCKRSYHTFEDLYAHLARIHFIFKCSYCEYTAMTRSELIIHKRGHGEVAVKDHEFSEITLSVEKELINEIDAVSLSPQDLVIDTNDEDTVAKSEDIQKANSVIAKVMSNKIFLLNAKKARQHKNRKICDVCHKTFDRVGDLKRHLIEHVIRSTLAKTPVNKNGTLTIHCEVCQMETFSKVDRYKEHLREHAKLTLYKCIFCDKSFSDSSNFSKHKKIHGTSFLQCDLCQRKFNSKKMIARHMEYHNKNTPIKCYNCEKDFYFPSMLKKHIKHAHTREITRTKCKFCHQYFKTLKEKWDHEWIIHNVRKMIVDCLLCGWKFRKYSELKRHCKDAHDMAIPPARKLLKRKAL